jgi:hypothetical protein
MGRRNHPRTTGAPLSRESLGLPPLPSLEAEAPQTERQFSERPDRPNQTPRLAPITEEPLHLGIYAGLFGEFPGLERAKEVISSQVSFQPLDVPRAIIVSHRAMRIAQDAVNAGGQPFKERAAACLTDLYQTYGAGIAEQPLTPTQAIAFHYPTDTEDPRWLLAYKLTGHEAVDGMRQGIQWFLAKCFSEARTPTPRDMQIGNPALAIGFVDDPGIIPACGKTFANSNLGIGEIALQPPQLVTQPGQPAFQ